MPTKRINQIFKEMSFDKKILGIGTFLLLVSVFLPWYSDVDSFKTGDMFLGITGPLYLAGFSILALGIIDAIFLISDISGRKINHITFKSSTFYTFSGIAVFYLLLVINSVYFHSKFGLNITLKESQFGMFIAFIATSLITIGGYLSSRDKVALLKQFEEQTRDTIKIPEMERKPRENLRNETFTRVAPEPVAVEPELFNRDIQ